MKKNSLKYMLYVDGVIYRVVDGRLVASWLPNPYKVNRRVTLKWATTVLTSVFTCC